MQKNCNFLDLGIAYSNKSINFAIQNKNETDMATNTRLLKSIEKLNAELAQLAIDCGEDFPILYEDANTTFGLRSIKLNGTTLTYEYNYLEYWRKGGAEWKAEKEKCFDEDEVKDWLKFWRACMKRARKYNEMHPDTLDAIQNGEAEDVEIENM
jgi:hypothetical protein